MIDVGSEKLIRLQDVPKLPWLPTRRGSGRIHVSTVFRWQQRGLGGQRLEAIKVGGTLCTSEPALMRFFERLTEPEKPVTHRTSAQRARAVAAAEAELAAAGIK